MGAEIFNEIDFGREAGFGKEEVVTRPNIVAQPIKEQISTLDTLINRGRFFTITPDNFPGFPPQELALSRFYAYGNLASALQEVRYTTLDPSLKEKLGVAITALIKERDQDLGSIVRVNGEGEDAIILSSSFFKQTIEQNQSLELAIRMGLVEQINGRNFPALRTLTNPELDLIRATTLGNRLVQLRDLKAQANKISSPPGFSSDRESSISPAHYLDEEISLAEEEFMLLLQNVKRIQKDDQTLTVFPPSEVAMPMAI